MRWKTAISFLPVSYLTVYCKLPQPICICGSLAFISPCICHSLVRNICVFACGGKNIIKETQQISGKNFNLITLTSDDPKRSYDWNYTVWLKGVAYSLWIHLWVDMVEKSEGRSVTQLQASIIYTILSSFIQVVHSYVIHGNPRWSCGGWHDIM